MYIKEAELVNIEFINSNYTYNIGLGGYGGDMISQHPDILNIKNKISITSKQQWKDGKHRNHHIKISGNKNGRYNGNGTTENTILKLKSKKTHIWTDDEKLLHSVKIKNSWTADRKKQWSKKQIGENNTFYGKTHSDESKQKISTSSKNRTVSNDTKNKISNTLFNIKRSDSFKDKHKCNKNGRAKKFILISPSNEQFFAHGNINEVLKQLNLSKTLIFKFKNKGVVNTTSNGIKNKYKDIHRNTQGWYFYDVSYYEKINKSLN